MVSVLALLAPGQGAQKPGFLTPWVEGWAGAERAATRLRWLSIVSGVDLVHLGTAADEDEIRDTAKTQPLMVAAGLVAAETLPLDEVAVVAGHSVGELTAAALAEVLSPEAAVTLAALRGREMAAACELEPTGMRAVLGGNEGEVLAKLDEFGLFPANRNGANQIVAGGPLAGLEKLSENPPAKAKIIPLQVAGAFHTRYMAPAKEAFGQASRGFRPGDPMRLLLSNRDGIAVTTGAEAMNRILQQITSTVRWDLCQSSLADMGVTAAVELVPAGTLAGLAKRVLKGVELVTVNTPDDLAAAADLIARHSNVAGAEPAVHFHVAVAPAAGVFIQAEMAEGDAIPTGGEVGAVETRQGPVAVRAVHGGVLAEWLAHAGDPVAPGQPLARLHPAGGER